MVAPIIAGLIIVGGILFFSRGGFSQFEAFADSIKSEDDREKGTSVIPTLQTGKGSVPIASGSQRTVNSIEVENILRTNVADKRKFAPDKPQIKVLFDNPKEGGVLATQTGQIVGANLSVQSGQQFGTGQFGLDQKEVSEIRSRDFTDQEKSDIARLQIRFNRKSASAQRVSDSPEEIVFKKREQEAIAIKKLSASKAQGGFGANFTFSGGVRTRGGFLIEEKGGLFGSSNFALGGKTREEFAEDQRQKGLIEAKIQENKVLAQQRIETGEQVISTIKKSGLNQKQFFQERGIGLRGGNTLSALAIGKIISRTGSLTKTVNPRVEPEAPVEVQLTSKQVFALSDADKIARFRRGERFT